MLTYWVATGTTYFLDRITEQTRWGSRAARVGQLFVQTGHRVDVDSALNLLGMLIPAILSSRHKGRRTWWRAHCTRAVVPRGKDKIPSGGGLLASWTMAPL